MKKPNLINSKTVFLSTLIVAPTLSLLIYLSGTYTHRTLYLNSLLSTTILSVLFFTFISIGLYNGWKLRDTLGNFLHKFHLWEKPSFLSLNTSEFEPHIGEGVEGFIVSLLIWVILALFGSFLFWLLGAMIWVTILLMAGMLYWIIFRALRLIFRNSPKCKGELLKSLRIALLFTILYNCWIYAIILGTHYLNS